MKLYMKMKYSIVLLFLIASLYTISAGENDTIAFKISLGAINPGGIIHVLDIFNEIHLQKDCSIKFYVSPLKKCYMYLINHDTEGNITIYFPPENTSPVETGTKDFFIPPEEESWLMVKGKAEYDRFYLLVSTKPLKDLHKKIKGYSKALLHNNENEISKRKDELLEEIQLLKNQCVHNEKIESPVHITGTVKGNQEDLKSIPVIIRSKENLYAHTIKIIHEQ